MSAPTPQPRGRVVPFPAPPRELAPVVEPYHLDPGFERALVYHICGTARVCGKLAADLDPAALAHPLHRLAVEAAFAIFAETGMGPSRHLFVLQRLRKNMVEGKVTPPEVEAIGDLFDEVEDTPGGAPDGDALLAEVRPILQRRVHRGAIQDLIPLYTTASTPEEQDRVAADIVRRVERVRDVAAVDGSMGLTIGDDTMDLLDELRNIPRFPTGIVELDDAMSGGPYLGTGNMLLAGTGVGKTMSLVQIAGAAALRGELTCVVTLELSMQEWMARVISNLTAIPLDFIYADPTASGAKARMRKIMDATPYVRPYIKEFPARVTSPAMVFAYVRSVEQTTGKKVRCLVVDYADKMISGDVNADRNGYERQGLVYDQFFAWARDNGRWVWTASAAKSKHNNRNADVLDDGDVADSQGKARNFDTVISLNQRDEGQSILWYGAKYRRGGKGGFRVGPLPADFACCRVGPVIMPAGLGW